MRLALAAIRLVRFTAALALSARDLRRSSGTPAEALHRAAQRLLRALGIEVTLTGPIPEHGLLVCNHLSTLDILLIAAATPATFVAKREVARWPVFGEFARAGGTLFIDRGRASRAPTWIGRMASAIDAGGLVVLFAEGTSTGGASVLPFRSTLFEAAVGRPLWAAGLAYALLPGDGDPAEELCYWKDMALVPHLTRVFTRRQIRAGLAFGPVSATGDRKTLAAAAHAEVVRLKSQAERTAPRQTAGVRGPAGRLQPAAEA